MSEMTIELVNRGRELEAERMLRRGLPEGAADACDRSFQRSDELEARAFAMPATTPAGFLVKLNEIEESIRRTGIGNPEAMRWIASLRLDLEAAGGAVRQVDIGHDVIAARWEAVKARRPSAF